MGLIDKLEGAEAAWPVATSESSAERFEVSDAKFQRRIRFFADDAVVTELFLGTSPGFRRVHAPARRLERHLRDHVSRTSRRRQNSKSGSTRRCCNPWATSRRPSPTVAAGSS